MPRLVIKLFLSVSVRVSLEGISIWISRLSEEDPPHQFVWESSSLLRAWIEQKGVGRVNLLSLLELRRPPFCPQTLMLQWILASDQDWWAASDHWAPILRPLDSDWITPLTFLGLQLAGSSLWDFLASITMWANFHYSCLGNSLVVQWLRLHAFTV